MTALKRGSREAEGEVESPGKVDNRIELWLTADGVLKFGHTDGRGPGRSPSPPVTMFSPASVPSSLHVGGADQERGTTAARLMLILVRAVGSPMDWFGL